MGESWNIRGPSAYVGEVDPGPYIKPEARAPLILNLGCGGPGLRSWHPLDGAINRDPNLDGWKFEDGLGDYPDGSVDGISVSHALMYVAISDWPAVFAEFARVLRDGGVVRITEDATDDTRSRTYPKGWHDVVTLTSASLVKRHLEQAGLIAHDCAPNETLFGNRILIQQFHGDPPHCFWVEGARMTRVLLSPHCDDESLFSAFTILRYRPRVVVCCSRTDGDYGERKVRQAETRDAMAVLGGDPVEFWDGCDLVLRMGDLDARVKPSLVFAPNVKASHPDHVAVAAAAREVFGDRLRTYHTYDANGKVREGREAEYEPVWIQAKLRALARYESQIRHPRAHAFFLEDLREFLGDQA